MSDVKEAANKLYTHAISKKLNFPKIWEETKCIQTCAATLLVHRTPDGFDTEEAFNDLVEKYGLVEEKSTATVGEKKKRKASSAAEAVITAAVEDEDGDDDNKPKKAKKIESVAEEENRVIADAIREMSTIYFKNKDARKGGVFSKAAKAIRECNNVISCKKDAMALKGVGKGIAGYIEEMLETGKIIKLEELRAGMA